METRRDALEEQIQECYRQLDEHGLGDVTSIFDRLMKLHFELAQLGKKN